MLTQFDDVAGLTQHAMIQKRSGKIEEGKKHSFRSVLTLNVVQQDLNRLVTSFLLALKHVFKELENFSCWF